MSVKFCTMTKVLCSKYHNCFTQGQILVEPGPHAPPPPGRQLLKFILPIRKIDIVSIYSVADPFREITDPDPATNPP